MYPEKEYGNTHSVLLYRFLRFYQGNIGVTYEVV